MSFKPFKVLWKRVDLLKVQNSFSTYSDHGDIMKKLYFTTFFKEKGISLDLSWFGISTKLELLTIDEISLIKYWKLLLKEIIDNACYVFKSCFYLE